jgi:hypothetical protein
MLEKRWREGFRGKPLLDGPSIAVVIAWTRICFGVSARVTPSGVL